MIRSRRASSAAWYCATKISSAAERNSWIGEASSRSRSSNPSAACWRAIFRKTGTGIPINRSPSPYSPLPVLKNFATDAARLGSAAARRARSKSLRRADAAPRETFSVVLRRRSGASGFFLHAAIVMPSIGNGALSAPRFLELACVASEHPRTGCAQYARLFKGNTPHRGFRLFLDLRFAIAAAAPPRKREPRLDRLLEFLVVHCIHRMRFPKRERSIKERLLNLPERLRHRRRNPLLRHERFPFFTRLVPPRQHHRAFGHVLRP